MSIYIYIYIYIYTHTRIIYEYIYIYIERERERKIYIPAQGLAYFLCGEGPDEPPERLSERDKMGYALMYSISTIVNVNCIIVNGTNANCIVLVYLLYSTCYDYSYYYTHMQTVIYTKVIVGIIISM